ncbi:MAG TPA: hypothetical protein VEQ10_01535 [Vicinamibacteria bacterium]|nr:hypothetical protein [Vicinamibacteria bacterium]
MALALACAACGGSDDSSSSAPTLSGNYELRLTRSPSCNPVGGTTTYSFPMVMTAAGTTPYPGMQVTLDNATPGLLELELKYTNFVLEGGFGAADNIASDEGPLVFVRAIGTGSVTKDSSGRGEVLSGSLRGLVQVGGDQGDPCNARDHSFTLRPR